MTDSAERRIAGVAAPPELFNFAEHLFTTNAGRPGKAAFVDDFATLGYGELEQRARRIAAALRAAGVKREERVLIMTLDGVDWPVAFLGAIYAGIVPVAVNTLLTADEYAYLLEHSRAQAVFVSGALKPVLKGALIKSDHEVQKVVVSRPTAPLEFGEIEFAAFLETAGPLTRPAHTRADEPAFWLYSSGSTGRPKGAVHSHANRYWTVELYGKAILALREDDICFSAVKLFFAYGLGNALTFPMGVGATILLMSERPTPDAVFARRLGGVGGLKPTVFYGAPTGFAGMLASPNLPKRQDIALRLVSSAGEALPAEIGERFERQFGVDIVDGIGSTEMLHIFISNLPDRARYGTTGWPAPGYDIELRGEDDRPVPDGEPGDLFIHGPSSALMYWGNRAKSRETFQGGWTKAGDKYIRNPDGSYTYAGRTDDMLKVGGVYVSPFEVEATLVQHHAVLEAAVIGVPDADGLTKPKAFVVLRAGAQASEAELAEFVRQRLAAYKYPRTIEFLPDLPKTATGKIQRFKLREREASAA
ncbi:MAG: benzoate-CoA ligase family protein [Roseiarcus sp.]